MTYQAYLETARLVIAGELPLKTTAIYLNDWKKAQEIVGKILGASNDTYVHPTLLYGLIERTAEALAEAQELGGKSSAAKLQAEEWRRRNGASK